MKAMRLVQLGAPLAMSELELPEPKGRAALVKVEACGVCHTDVHLSAGFYDLGDGKKQTLLDGGAVLPLTLGHEIAGKLVAMGEGVPEGNLRPGDAVVVYPWIGCGACRSCAVGQENMCEGRPRNLGVFIDGGYAEHVLVPDARYLVATRGISPSQAAPLACSGITALGAIKKSGAGPAMTLAVIGVGGLGSTAIQLAKAAGSRVIALDVRDSQLELATSSGADQVLNTSGMAPEAVPSAVKRLNDGKGVEVVVDFVGSGDTFTTGFRLLVKRGRLVSVGLFGGAAQFPLPILVQKQVELAGSYTGTLSDLVEMVKLVDKRVVSPVVSDTVRLEEVNTALERLRTGNARGRLLVAPGS